MLKQFSQTRANRLERLCLPPVTEPFKARILWLRSLVSEKAVALTSKTKHRHSFFEAHFIFSGEMSYESDGRRFVVESGNGIIFAPHIHHTVLSVSPDAVKLSVALTVDEGEAAFDGVRSRKAYLFRFDEGTAGDFDGIFADADKRGAFLPVLVRNRIVSVLCSVLPLGSEPDEESTGREDIRITAAKRYIEDNKQLFLTCNEVAEYCHFNAKYFNRIFKRSEGKTLLEYIHDVKRKEAERLLLDTDTPLSQIAELLGFDNESYFNAFFKRLCGITPGEYRRFGRK